ncbi:MAG: DUF1801 domain-containing protein [Gemmatimonadaceae bacterium]
MSTAKSVDDYLAALPADRRREIEAVRAVVLENLPRGYEESMGFGMIAYSVPKTRLSETYNGHALMYAALAAQKNHNAVYLMGVYSDEKRAKTFVDAFAKAGKKLDIGKSCVRFKRADDLALDAIGDSIRAISVDDYVALYEKSRLLTKAGQKKAAAKKAVKK